MTSDIFSFWTQAADAGVLERPGRKIHPADESTFESHDLEGFDLNSSPEPFYGPLATAPVVLLALNHNGEDAHFANHPELLAAHKRAWQGHEPLWHPREFDPTWTRVDWMASMAKRFGITDWDVVRNNFAIINLWAYRSPREVKCPYLEFPSTQVAVEWVSDVLYPTARNKGRVVICIYKAKEWGLKLGSADGYLFTSSMPGEIPFVERPAIIDAINEVRGRG